MNLYFLKSQYVNLSIQQLLLIVSFKKLAIGDLAVLRVDKRLILIIINSSLKSNVELSEYPMVAQVICEDKKLPKLLPMLYYNDGYSRKICDINGLQFLLNIFSKNKLASNFMEETLALAKGKISQRDTKLVLQLFKCSTSIPLIKKDSIISNKSDSLKEGKLLIVEKYFTSRMKQEFYNYITLGLTEREILVKLRRKYPKFFSRILIEFRDKDIYTRI